MLQKIFYFTCLYLLVFFLVDSDANLDNWKGKWFPTIPSTKSNAPSSQEMTFDLNKKGESGNWKGKWFPKIPITDGKMFDLDQMEDYGKIEKWAGKWFPTIPGSIDKNYDSQAICDNGETNLNIDFDPQNIFHSLYYNCYENRKFYEPNYSIEPILIKFEVPEAYTSMYKCMNETISYDLRLPTFGTHRFVGPKFGDYVFVPPQRWLTSVESGAIVVLYHPCANKPQINKLKSLVKGCLFQYIISASDQLTNDRPFAIIAYKNSLEMSVIDNELIVKFIRKYALKKTIPNSNNTYSLELITTAEILSPNDQQLCPKNTF